MRKTTLLKRLFFGCLLLVLLSNKQVEAQIVIGKPNLGFSQACASASFNTYNTTFIFSPEVNLGPSNQFIVEMSDADGDFSNPTIVYTSNSGEVTSSPATLSFAIPNTTAGEGYELKIRSTDPVASSSPSDAFAAYYKIQDSPFTINNLVSTGAFCIGGSYLLTIDNPGSGDNDSPLNYPSLTFNWYRETSPTTADFIAEGNTLIVDQEGTYFVETNYGTCTSNSFSNRVTIVEASSGEANTSISSSLGNPFCPDQGATTLNAIGGNSYQWFKDGEAISGATEQMYQTDQPGTYSVQVDLGECQASGSIDLETEGFTSSINVSEFNTMDEGETLTVIVTSSASNPIFEWFFNDTLIQGETTDTYVASEFGSYKVVVSQTSGCSASTEFHFTITEPFPDVGNIPNLISPNGDGINDTWVIPTQFVNGTNTEVIIFTNRGEIALQTNNYLNNWPQNQLDFKSINLVYYYIIKPENQQAKKGSITVVK
jgi:gliding motility-associated-like protein